MTHIAPHALEDDTARTQRHMRLCAELAELAMQLARATAARALVDLADSDQAAAAPSAAAEPASKPLRATRTCKQADPTVLFTRLAATIRDCIKVESRLAAGLAPHASTAAPRIAAASATDRAAHATALRADPRRTPLREAVAYLLHDTPDRAERLRHATPRIDENLAADPDHKINFSTLLYSLCDEFNIEVDFSKLPDATLDLLDDPNTTAPP